MKPLEPEVLRSKFSVFVPLDCARHELEREIAAHLRIADQVTDCEPADLLHRD